MNRLLKKTLKALGILMGILLVLYIIVFAYISANKKSIIKQVTDNISKKLNGNVTIGDVELSFIRTFPRASVLLNDVTITDTMYAQHHHTFLQAKEVFAKLSIIRLIKKESAVNGVRIEEASIYLFTDTSGYTNTYLIKPKKDSVSNKINPGNKNELKSVVLRNVRLTINDMRKLKLQDFVVSNLTMKLDNQDPETLLLSAKAKVLVQSLSFFIPAGSFLKDKIFEGDFDLTYDKRSNQLHFDSIEIKLSGHRFNLSGSFDLAAPNPQFSLRIHTRKIPYPFAKTLLTKKIDSALTIVDLDKTIDADVMIRGPLNGGDPLINMNWNVKGTHLTTPFFDFDDASFRGSYTNEVVQGLPRRDPNSKIIISDFSASWHGLPATSSNIEVLNLYEPTLTCDLQSAFSLIKLNELLGSSSLILESGSGTVDLTYKGPIVRNNNTNSFINGLVTFKNGTIHYAPRNVNMNNVNGRLAFRNSDVFIENLQCEVLNNKIIMNGEARNLLTLINTEPDRANIDWNIFSPSLNLGAFTYLLKSRGVSSYKKPGKGGLQDISKKIDAVLDKGRLNVNLRATRMTYKKLEASNVVANVSLLQDKYLINSLRMEQSGGHMNMNGSLITQKSNYHQADLSVSLENVDVSKVFKDFNNFGQDGIIAQNLSGKLSSTVKAKLLLNDDGIAYPNSIQGIVDFSLKKGTLINFDPVKKLQNFLFKNRDFENIQFAELKDRLEISKGEIKINRMEIQSSVLTLFVEGIYSMKGTTDMNIQVPLKNLKKRNEDYKPENQGADKKGGASIYIRGCPGADGTIQFKPDLFKKLRKGN